jgi:hypothetical protein
MLQVLGYVLSTLDLAAWLLTFGPIKLLMKFLKSKPRILPTSEALDAPRRRVTGSKELLAVPFPEVQTLYDIMKRSSSVFSDRPCLGSRQYLKEGTPDPAKGQRFPPKVFGDTTWLTYKEAFLRMEAFGRGLRQFGLKPQPELKAGQTFDQIEGDCLLIVYENT